MAIKIKWLSDDADAVRGAKKVEDALADVSDELDDVARDGKDTERSLSNSFRDISRDVDRTADDIGTSMRKADDDVKKFGSNARDELHDSAREGAASFSGEFSDIGDVLQETAANLGPAGLVGAAVIGAVIATATDAVEGWDEKIQGIKDSTADMWQKAAEAGDQFIDSASIKAEAYRLLWDEAFKDQFDAAEEAGVKRSDLAIALAEGEGEAYDRVHQRLLDAFKEQAKEATYASDTYKEQGEAAMIAAGEEAKGIGAVIGILNEKSREVDKNKALTREAGEVTATVEEQQRDQIRRTRDAAQTRYEQLAALYANPIKATIDVEVRDRTEAGLRAITDKINKRRAALGVNVYGIGGREIQ